MIDFTLPPLLTPPPQPMGDGVASTFLLMIVWVVWLWRRNKKYKARITELEQALLLERDVIKPQQKRPPTATRRVIIEETRDIE